jgi:hypothetical protein
MFGQGLLPGRTLSSSDYLWTATPWSATRAPDVPVPGSNFEQVDAPLQFHPPLVVTKRTLPHVPLWDSDTLSGRPFVADPQSGIFSPFSLPGYVLDLWTALGVIAVLKLFVAAFGTYLLGRELGMRQGGALLAGLVFGFSLWSVTWVAWPTMSVWAWLPWMWLLAERCLRRPGPLPAAGLALVVGLQFLGGHPSSSFQVLVVTAVLVLLRALATEDLRRRLPLRLLTLGAAGATGVALAAVMLAPFVELLARSDDLDARKQAADLLHQSGERLLGIVLPDFWGHGPTGQIFGGVLPERAYYVGALPLMLALVALVLRPRAERIVLAVTAVLMLMVATGMSPVYGIVVKLPGFAAANNGRVAVIAVLAVALLSGWGLDDMTDGRAEAARTRRRIALALACALAVLPVLLVARRVDLTVLGPAVKVAWGFADPRRVAPAGPTAVGEVLKLAALLKWLLPAALALGVLVLALRVLPRPRPAVGVVVALALVLVAADLFRAGMGYNPAIPRRHAEQPTTDAIRYLQRQGPARFTGLKSLAPAALAQPLPPNTAMRYRVHDARGYVLPSEGRYFTLWRDAIAPSPRCYYFFCTETPVTTPRALHALGLLGVTLLLQNVDDQPLRGMTAVYDGPDARIYRNPRGLPRAFLVDRQVVVHGEQAALTTVTRPSFPSRSVAVTEEAVPGLAQGAAGARPDAGTARITHDGDDLLSVGVDARRPSLLVVGDTWYPGWKATVDGRDATIHRVNYVTRGIAVPAGAHRVELRYEPASWRMGWVLSLLALVAVAAAAAVGLRRRRRVAAG